MSEKIETYIVKPKPLGDLPHHEMDKIKKAMQAFIYLNDSLVAGSDLVIHIGEIHQLTAPIQPYVDQHKHDVSSAYALIGDLTLEVIIEGEKREVAGPAGVFIPAGKMHSVRPLRGTGYFIVIQRSGKFE
ncbi:MAG: hypothetical protein H6Q42_4570 [Deltaproteobacteria bacterium]|nr:hypothetical protein [Deltaproteobacteria bacterium]